MILRKKKKKRTKKQLITLLIFYIAASVALCAGFLLYVRHEQKEAAWEQKKAVAEERVQPALAEAETVLTSIIEEREQLPADAVTKVMDTHEEIWDVGEIGSCLDSLQGLKGAKTFESFGGYTIPEESRKALRELFTVFENRGWNLGFILMDIHTGKGVAYNCDEVFYSASSVKGPYMVSLIANDPDALEENRGLFDAIAQTSDNMSYNYLFYQYGNEYFNAWCEEAGIEPLMDYNYNYVWYSPRMLASLWMLNYRFFITDEENGDNAAALFDHPSYSTIKTSLGKFYSTWTKSGWINLRYQAVIDSGIVSDGEHPFLLTLMTDYSGDLLELNAITCELEKVHADMVGENSRLTKYYIEKIKKDYPIGYWWR